MRKFISKSIDIATEVFPFEENKKTFHFAFAWRRNKLLGIGQNNTEKMDSRALKFAKRFGNKKQKRYPYLHSEVDLISRLWGREYIDNKLNIVVVRLNRKLELQNSMPCDSCKTILRVLGPKVWFSDKEGNIQQL